MQNTPNFSIYLKTIVSSEEEITKLEENEYLEKLAVIEKRQPHLNNYIDAALDSFEDEEEFADKFLFYVLVIHNAFSKIKRFLPEITVDNIREVEEQELVFFEKLDAISEEEGEIAIDYKIANHPQRHLLRYLQAELNEVGEEETDDHIEELNIHIFWLLSAIISMYDISLQKSGFDPNDGRDGLDKREKKEWRDQKKKHKPEEVKSFKTGHDKKKFRDKADFEDFSTKPKFVKNAELKSKDEVPTKHILVKKSDKSDSSGNYRENKSEKPFNKNGKKENREKRDEFFKPRF